MREPAKAKGLNFYVNNDQPATQADDIVVEDIGNKSLEVDIADGTEVIFAGSVPKSAGGSTQNK